MLRPIRFHCCGVWISAVQHCIGYIYIYNRPLLPLSYSEIDLRRMICTGFSGTQLLLKSGSVCGVSNPLLVVHDEWKCKDKRWEEKSLNLNNNIPHFIFYLSIDVEQKLRKWNHISYNTWYKECSTCEVP
jgi:hypothetical protein